MNSGLQEVLRAAIDMLCADMGCLQLFDNRGQLMIVAQHGLAAELLAQWCAESANGDTTCRRALLTRQCSLVEDVELDPGYQPYLHLARSAGYRAELSTPLLAADGTLQGVITIHFRRPHSLAPEQSSRLELYVRLASDFVERCQIEQVLRDSETRYRALTQATSDIVYIMSSDWMEMKLLSGRGFLRDTQTPSRSWLHDYIPKNVRPQVLAAIQRAISVNRIFELEHPVIQIDQSIGWVHTRAVPILNKQNQVVEWFGTASNITSRKVAESKLQESEERFRAVFEFAPLGICITDMDGRIQMCNHAYETILGYSPAELQNLHYSALIHGDDVSENLTQVRRLLSGEISFVDIENRYVHKDGHAVWVHKVGSVLKGHDGVPKYIMALVSDITELRESVEALREREEHLQAVLNAASDVVFTVDRHVHIVDVNSAVSSVFGYDKQTLIGHSLKELFPNAYFDTARKCAETRGLSDLAGEFDIGSNRSMCNRVLCRRRDGTHFPVYMTVNEIDHLQLYIVTFHDLSQVKMLERDVLTAAEDEQRRIGQDLHDGIQQELTCLGLFAHTLADKLRSAPIADDASNSLSSLATKIASGITQVHKELQRVSRGLIPIALGKDGLVDALQQLANHTDNTAGVRCQFCGLQIVTIDSTTATHLYRIAQEAVANALKHAAAQRIEISLVVENGHLVLRIVDDGIGVPALSENVGMGMRTMNYRASLIGATFSIEPVAAGGTLVTCKLLEFMPTIAGDP